MFPAFLCVLLLLSCCLEPKAKAGGFTLAAVAGTTAFLMASGIYPYMTDASQTVAAWTQDNLQPLIDKFNDYLVATGKSCQLTLNGSAPTVKGFFQQGAIVIATEVWARLREFAGWVVDEYAVTDDGLQLLLGEVDYAFPMVPYRDDLWSLKGPVVASESMCVYCYPGSEDYLMVSVPDVFAFYGSGYFAAINSNINDYLVLISRSSYNILHVSGVNVNRTYGSYGSPVGVAGNAFYYATYHVGNSKEWRNPSIPLYSIDEAVSVFFGDSFSSFSGVTADTSTVSIPDELPEGAEWGGLMVEGAQDVVSPSAVEDVIESAIQTRDKPVVRPATVTVPEGMEIDPDNGDATPPIVLTPFPLAPPDAMELTDDVVEALKSHFPFSIPWDLYNLASAINAEPVAPTFRVSTPQIGEMSPVSFELDIGATAFDDYAYVFRAFTGLLICVWLLIGASKFIRR